jgi:hypothetical protein
MERKAGRMQSPCSKAAPMGIEVKVAMVNLSGTDSWKKRVQGLLQGRPAKTMFVVGAGLSWDGSVGVWGVSDILKHVKGRYRIESDEQPSSAYQDVLFKLKADKGAGVVEGTIRLAILAAAKDSKAKTAALHEVEAGADLTACRALQADPEAWSIPNGVAALADLIGLVESRVGETAGWQHPCVLSTNFDGLLEVALQQRGIKFKSDIVAGDQFPHAFHEQVSIVHLHGYWLRSPTLHDSAALQARRPSLEAALRDHLKGAQVFVMGYAGWNDIIFGTAAQVLDRQQSDHLPEVMWAFYESEKQVRQDDANPKSACGHVIAAFSGPVSVAQTTYYCGVDVHRDLPEVVRSLSPSVATTSGGGAATTASSFALQPYLEALLPAVPKNFQAEFQALLEDAKASKPVGLVGVVALCCRVLEDSPQNVELRARFSDPAWDLITFMVGELLDPLRPRSSGVATVPGEITCVPAKTHLLVGLLLAKNPDPRRLLRPDKKGAVSRDDLSPALRAGLFEPGPAEADRMLQFETLLWRSVYPTETSYGLGCKEVSCVLSSCARDCDRRDLYSRLGAEAAKGRPRFLVINPGAGSAWKDIAAKAREVIFVESDGNATAGLDDGKLAVLIGDFLKLTAKETA